MSVNHIVNDFFIARYPCVIKKDKIVANHPQQLTFCDHQSVKVVREYMNEMNT